MANNIDILINAKDNASRTIENVGGSISGLEKKTSGLSGTFSGFGSGLKSIGGTLLSVGAIGTTAIAGLGGMGLKMAGDFEQTSIAFKTMLGSGEQASILLKDLSKFAAETPFEFPELANAGKSLLAFGFSAKEIKGTLKSLGDVASSLNIPLGELSEIYGKARTQGRLFSEDINQLTGRGIPIIQELAKQFGVTDGEVKKLVEKGKVGFPELQKAMESMTAEGGKFAGGMANQSTSLQGLLSTVSDNIGTIFRELIGINLAGEVAAGSILEKAKNAASGFITFLNNNSENIKAFLQGVIDGFSNFFAMLIPIVQTALEFIRAYWKENGASITANVQEILTSLLAFWAKYGEDIKVVMQFIWESTKVAFFLIKSVIEAVMTYIGPLIEGILTTVGASFKVLASLLSGDFSGAWQGMKDFVGGLIFALGSIILMFGDLIARIFGTEIQTVLTNFSNFWTGVWEGIKSSFNSIVDMIGNYVVSKFTSIVQSITGFVDKIKGMVGQVKSFVSEMMSSASSLGSSIGGSISNTLGISGARANGGPVSTGKSYLVGENGPEIFTARTSGNIIPNGGGASSININFGGVTIQNDADENRLVEKIKKALVKEAKLYNIGIA